MVQSVFVPHSQYNLFSQLQNERRKIELHPSSILFRIFNVRFYLHNMQASTHYQMCIEQLSLNTTLHSIFNTLNLNKFTYVGKNIKEQSFSAFQQKVTMVIFPYIQKNKYGVLFLGKTTIIVGKQSTCKMWFI